ncbi:MAG: phosphoglycolate phosphatase [Xanthomonadales bacterium]|nr:phosphoglycolate phosphatase [Xanthomonadales bacterium]
MSTMFKFKPSAVVWDLDGTLVDSAPDLAAALNTVLDMRGFFTHSIDTVRTMIGNGVPKLVERGFNAVGVRPDPEQLDELIAVFVKEYKACATDNTRAYPGIVSALQEIQSMNIPMGVCTNKPEAFTRQILDGLDLSGYFSSVVGGDSTSSRKPDPEPVLACLRGLVSEPASSLMIGDSVHDVHAAHAAGVTVGVVPWGYRSAPVEALGADFVLSDASALPGMIREAQEARQQTAH